MMPLLVERRMLVVVLLVQHVLEQLRVLERHRDLGGERAEAYFVAGAELVALLVQDLGHTDAIAVLVDDGHGEDALGTVASRGRHPC